MTQVTVNAEDDPLAPSNSQSSEMQTMKICAAIDPLPMAGATPQMVLVALSAGLGALCGFCNFKPFTALIYPPSRVVFLKVWLMTFGFRIFLDLPGQWPNHEGVIHEGHRLPGLQAAPSNLMRWSGHVRLAPIHCRQQWEGPAQLTKE